jgi:hypothetical protein
MSGCQSGCVTRAAVRWCPSLPFSGAQSAHFSFEMTLKSLLERHRDWRDSVCNRRLHATGRFPVHERLAEERERLRPLPPQRVDHAYARVARAARRLPALPRLVLPRAGGSRASTRDAQGDRDRVWICHRGTDVARYVRSYEPGSWHLAPSCAPSRHRGRSPPLSRARGRAARALRLRGALRVSPRAKRARVGERLPYLFSKLKAPRVLERLGTTSPASSTRCCSAGGRGRPTTRVARRIREHRGGAPRAGAGRSR